MPARIVLPVSQPLAESVPADFEEELRRAVTSVAELDAEVSLELSCLACDAVEDGLDALRDALVPVFKEARIEADLQDSILQALLRVADSDSQIRAPPAKHSTEKRWETRGAVERARADEYLRRKEERDRVERAWLEERTTVLRAFYGPGEEVSEEPQPPEPAAACSSSSETDVEDIDDAARRQVKERLRQLGAPATLFGEDDAARQVRLRQCELSADHNETNPGSTNVLQLVERLAEKGVDVDRDDDEAEDAHSGPAAPADELLYPPGHQLREGEAVRIQATLEDPYFVDLQCANGDVALHWAAQSGKVASTSRLAGEWGLQELGSSPHGPGPGFVLDFLLTRIAWEVSVDGRRCPDLDFAHRTRRPVVAVRVPENLKAKTLLMKAPISASRGQGRQVLLWLRSTLRAWEADIVARSCMEDARKAKGERAIFRQSKQYLKPLRKALRDGSIDAGILASLLQMAEHCSRRRYRDAHEAYMRLAIGNSPWPIGVTQVTFHDRPNRHNIGEDNVAHILDDETTRKYIQMVKRLVSFCEAHWPVDASLAC